jgi:hypothetical protein
MLYYIILYYIILYYIIMVLDDKAVLAGLRPCRAAGRGDRVPRGPAARGRSEGGWERGASAGFYHDLVFYNIMNIM